ncbi:MAG: tRNA uridine(34) 5-carboxymethylaminomethyl modification radical SAM/GNAT enzyme Elp3 [bacterium]|nr:tRNA uridine(34) 5-carboxymethylaminomethyl modification radical SAM/GNAT enzyme Elp3 [bacterium]
MDTSEQMLRMALKEKTVTADRLNEIRRRILRTNKGETLPTTADLLKSYHKLVKNGSLKVSPMLERLLVKRAVRTLSGVSIVTSLAKPYHCPGKCVYCPNEPDMPKSYLAEEPAAARAQSLRFSPFLQMRRRLETLTANGHPTDKIELIVKGGTWNAYPLAYQYWFIAESFRAANGEKMAKPEDESVEKAKKELLRAEKKNETAKHRIIGVTLETRPDFITEKTVWEMRDQGCTRIELGAQSTDDKVMDLTKRGHRTARTKEATVLLKNYGFKVDYHLMPQLPGTTPKKDLKMLKEVFEDPDYRPDMIKIYPCSVIRDTELYEWFKAGKFKPYSVRELIETLVAFKPHVPHYCRISRLIRDIPGQYIKSGNRTTNLRQVIQQRMAEQGLKCKCLRCREIGHQINIKIQNSKNRLRTGTRKIKGQKTKLFIDEYEASGGMEYFLSFEDIDRQVVYAFCRLRINNPTNWGKNNFYQAIIRELHTYGQMLELGTRNKKASQHQGLGKQMMLAAEDICRKNKVKKLAVISGVGVRDYYRHAGFRLENSYMVKKLKVV